jgi:hypothetical protein
MEETWNKITLGNQNMNLREKGYCQKDINFQALSFFKRKGLTLDILLHGPGFDSNDSC